MAFPIINISSFDNKNNTFLKRFQSLSSESIKILNDANDYYTKIPHTVGIAKESSDGHRTTLIQKLNEIDATGFQHCLGQYRKDRDKSRLHRWHVEQHRILSDKNLWNTFQAKCHTAEQQNKLKALRRFWQSQARFSYYSSDALIEVTTQILPLFENYLVYLDTDYRMHQRSLPTQLKTDIKEYLKQLKEAIQLEKESLAEAMLARLKVASYYQTIYFDDVTKHVAWELDSMRLLKTTHGLPRDKPVQFDADLICSFQGFIMREGNSHQKSKLILLRWNKPDKHYVVTLEKDSVFIAPKKVLSFVESLPFIQKILGIDNRYKRFLASKTALFITLRVKPDPLYGYSTLKSFYDNEYWQKVCTLSQELDGEYEKSTQQKPSNFLERLFKNDQQQFITHWQGYIKEERLIVLTKAINFLKRISQELMTRLEFEIDIEMISSRAFQMDIKKFHEDVLSMIKHTDVDVDSIGVYQNFLPLYEKVRNLPEELAKAQQEKSKAEQDAIGIITEFIDWSLITNEKQKDTQKLGDSTSPTINHGITHLPTEDNFNPFQPIREEDILSDIGVILTDLIHLNEENENKTLDMTQQDVRETIKLIKTFGNFNQELLQQPHHKELCSALFKLYLTTWYQAKEEDKDTLEVQLEAIEFILNAIAPSFIVQRLQKLMEIRSLSNWYLFQVKCKSLLAGLEITESILGNQTDSEMVFNSDTLASRQSASSRASILRESFFKFKDQEENFLPNPQCKALSL